MSWYFDLTATNPTSCNLIKVLQQQGWLATTDQSKAHFSELHLAYPQSISQTIEFKHLLWQLVETIEPAIMPRSFVLDDTNWPDILSQLSRFPHPVWILKPALLNNGTSIELFTSLGALERHFLASDRLGGVHVLQQYLLHPHLLQGPELGHKYTLRVFVVLTQQGAAYLYPHGYFNIAIAPYNDQTFTQYASHLTNEHLSSEHYCVVQIPSFQYPIFNQFYPTIESIVEQVFRQLRSRFTRQFAAAIVPQLAIFGFDFLVDAQQKVWLLEANHGPCFPVSDTHPLQQRLYQQFWSEFLHQFIIPIVTKQPFSAATTLFKAIT